MKREAPDVFCIQETKCQMDDVPKVGISLGEGMTQQLKKAMFCVKRHILQKVHEECIILNYILYLFIARIIIINMFAVIRGCRTF